MSQGVKDSLTVLGLTLLTVAGGIATQSCLAWMLQPDGRGALAVAVAVATVLGTAFVCGTERATQYHVVSRKISVRQGVTLISSILLVASAIAALVGWVLIDSPLTVFDKADRNTFHLALALMPLMGATTAFALLLNARRRFRASGVADAIGSWGRLALITLLVGGAGLGVGGALLGMILSTVVVVVLQLAALSREFEPAAPRRPVLGSVFSYGLRYYVARMGTILSDRIGYIVLGFVGSRAEVGLYAAASVLVGRLLIVPNSISKALLPRVGASERGRPELVAQTCRASAAVSFLAIGLLLATSEVLIPLLLSPAFRPSIPLLWILAGGLWLRASTGPMAVYFIGINKPGIVSVATGVHLTILVVLLPSLYLRLGLHAAAWAEASGHAAAAAVFMVNFHRHSRLRVRETWWWQRADRALVRSLVAPLRAMRLVGRGHTI